MVTSIKIDIFVLITTRPIAHSGWFTFIRNCVGEFGTDTGQPLVTSNVVSNHLSDHHKAYYTYIQMYIQLYNAMCHMDTRQNFHQQQNLSFLLSIRKTVLIPGVCPYICIRSMMHYVHTGEAVVTSIKIDIFMLATTRPIAHSGGFVCIQYCVCEFGTDTGQPLVTSNVMSNHLSDQHKAYYTYIDMYIQMYNAMCHMDTRQNFISNKTYQFCYQKDRMSCRSVSVY